MGVSGVGWGGGVAAFRGCGYLFRFFGEKILDMLFQITALVVIINADGNRCTTCIVDCIYTYFNRLLIQ